MFHRVSNCFYYPQIHIHQFVRISTHPPTHPTISSGCLPSRHCQLDCMFYLPHRSHLINLTNPSLTPKRPIKLPVGLPLTNSAAIEVGRTRHRHQPPATVYSLMKHCPGIWPLVALTSAQTRCHQTSFNCILIRCCGLNGRVATSSLPIKVTVTAPQETFIVIINLIYGASFLIAILRFPLLPPYWADLEVTMWPLVWKVVDNAQVVTHNDLKGISAEFQVIRGFSLFS